MNSSSGLMSAIALLSAVLSWGCVSPSQVAQLPKKDTANTPAIESSTLSVAELVPEAPKIDARLQQLQPCLVDLEMPQLFPLALSLSPNISDPETEYFVAFSTKTLPDPQDVGKAKDLRTITLAAEQCQTLPQVQAQALATRVLNRIYKDQIALYKGDLDSAWSDIVNRWERDHSVSGPGDHPLVLAIEDIWVAKTLNLHLPDYVPIHISQ